MTRKIRNLIEYCRANPGKAVCQLRNDTIVSPSPPGLTAHLNSLNREGITLRPSDWATLATMLNEAGFYQDALNIAKIAEDQIEGANYLVYAQVLQIQGAALHHLKNVEASTIALDMAEKLLSTANLQNRLQNSIDNA